VKANSDTKTNAAILDPESLERRVSAKYRQLTVTIKKLRIASMSAASGLLAMVSLLLQTCCGVKRLLVELIPRMSPIKILQTSRNLPKPRLVIP
jgi:hypothetical protein